MSVLLNHNTDSASQSVKHGGVAAAVLGASVIRIIERSSDQGGHRARITQAKAKNTSPEDVNPRWLFVNELKEYVEHLLNKGHLVWSSCGQCRSSLGQLWRRRARVKERSATAACPSLSLYTTVQ